MKFPVLRSLCCGLASLIAMLGTATSASAQITPGNIVVVRVGDGLTSLSATSIVTFLDEYTTGGAFVQTIALPTGAATALTISGSGTSEGFLNQSIDGQYLVTAGYRAVPGVANIAATTSASRPRVIGRIALNETINTTTALTDAYSGSFIGSATSNDGLQFWTGGNSATSGSVRYAGSLGATTSTQLSTTITNTRVVFVHNGQLYVSASTGTFRGISTVGSGLPTTSGQTITQLPGFPTASGPSSFDYFFADNNTLYVADDRTTTSGGIQKWTFGAGTWTLQYTLHPASGIGARGLTGVVNAGVTTLYATTSPFADNRIVRVTDTGPSSSFLTLAESDEKSAFRGIRLIRTPCTGPSITTQPQNSSVCVGAPASFTVVASGSPTLTYQWRKNTVPLSNGGNISGATSATLTINPTTAGDAGTYDVVVTNGCGSITSAGRTLTVDSTDTDGDGTANCNDGCPNDPNKTAPGICGCGVSDADTDGDGTANCNDGCPNDPNKTAPGICGCGVSDADTDGDGTANCNDGCPNDPNKTAPGICGCGVSDADTDGDGTANCNDGCPNDPNKTAPGQCGCGVADTDTDGDGTANCNDGCPNDPNKTAPGICGCGVSDADTDGDGTADCNDGCPDDPNKTAPGICGCGVSDADTDGDGTADCNDGCPDDPNKTAPGQCGCGIADTDTDGDGTADCNDGCPDDPNKVLPGQCGCGIADTDTDLDGVADCNDGCPTDPDKTAPGVCGCGFADLDDDFDGIFDCVDNCPGLANPGQADADGDGKGDDCDNCDLDSNPNQEDCDNDGVGDACAGEPDCNLNGVPDSCDITAGTSQDLNGDGVPDECVVDTTPFCFGDGTETQQCPCGNNGAPGNGCANSTHPGGANLASTGVPSLANDTLKLHVTDQHPSSLSLFVQGTLEVGPFLYGDGLRCVGGQLKRIFVVKNAHSKNITAPSAMSIPPTPATVSGQSAALGDPLFVGAVRGYMVFYRDPNPNFCPTGTFNVTNALRVVWSL